MNNSYLIWMKMKTFQCEEKYVSKPIVIKTGIGNIFEYVYKGLITLLILNQNKEIFFLFNYVSIK